MYPARWFYRKHEDQPTTEVAIRRTPAEDLYLVMPAYELKDQSMSLQVVINPLVNWIWVGFGILVLGTGIALLPERVFAYGLAPAASDAASS
jgi:cytochrome c-type biogenesis protein CcmF